MYVVGFVNPIRTWSPSNRELQHRDAAWLLARTKEYLLPAGKLLKQHTLQHRIRLPGTPMGQMWRNVYMLGLVEPQRSLLRPAGLAMIPYSMCISSRGAVLYIPHSERKHRHSHPSTWKQNTYDTCLKAHVYSFRGHRQVLICLMPPYRFLLPYWKYGLYVDHIWDWFQLVCILSSFTSRYQTRDGLLGSGRN